MWRTDDDAQKFSSVRGPFLSPIATHPATLHPSSFTILHASAASCSLASHWLLSSTPSFATTKISRRVIPLPYVVLRFGFTLGNLSDSHSAVLRSTYTLRERNSTSTSERLMSRSSKHERQHLITPRTRVECFTCSKQPVSQYTHDDLSRLAAAIVLMDRELQTLPLSAFVEMRRAHPQSFVATA